MLVKRFSEAKGYEAPNHRDYKSFRVFGAEMGGSQTLIFGISHFMPGGGAGPDASPPEKIYYVLAGAGTVTDVARAEAALAAGGVAQGLVDRQEIEQCIDQRLLVEQRIPVWEIEVCSDDCRHGVALLGRSVSCRPRHSWRLAALG